MSGGGGGAEEVRQMVSLCTPRSDRTVGEHPHSGPRKSFPAFPYTPYAIQQELMEQIWSVLDRGGVGLFESPTGTGKTLTLICAVLHWLEDHRERAARGMGSLLAEPPAGASGPGSPPLPAWMSEQHASQCATEALRARERRAERARRLKERVEEVLAKQQMAARKARGMFGGGSGGAPGPESGAAPAPASDPDEDLVLDDGWDSEGGEGPGCAGGRRRRRTWKQQGHGVDDSGSSDDGEGLVDEFGDALPDPGDAQVVFCSRTHSQLSQFVAELRRTEFADRVSVAPLGSRRTLCINDRVLAQRTAARINDACLDLQHAAGRKRAAGPGAPGGAASTSGGCPFYQRRDVSGLAQARDSVLARPMDVEELVAVGRDAKQCPYYAARAAARHADVVAVPYAAVLSARTREALGVRLAGSVVVFDEAHNVADAVHAAHCAEVTADQCQRASGCLARYLERFGPRLSPGNRLQLSLLVRAADALHAYMAGLTAPRSALSISELLFGAGIDGINFLRLARFVSDSKVLFKVSTYVERQRLQQPAESGDGSSVGGRAEVGRSTSRAQDKALALAALQALTDFVAALSAPSKDGRVLPIQDPGRPRVCSALRFVLLNAAAVFGNILQQARAVVFASGTLSPFEALKRQLMPDMGPSRIAAHSCGHVVPDDHLLGLCVGAGPTGVRLDYRAKARGSPDLLAETGRIICNLSRVVPGGTVVFFPSFAFLDQARTVWAASGQLQRMTEASRGGVFWEPRASREVEAALAQFAGAVESSGAAVLMSVVGGKLSEGINFANRLGRCVVVLGLPYPNPDDPELVERMAFLDTAAGGDARKPGGEGAGTVDAQGAGAPPPRFAGRQYLDSLCIRALNQSIGRVIRHREDFAAVVLLDCRYVAALVDDPTAPSAQGPAPRGALRESTNASNAAPAAKSGAARGPEATPAGGALRFRGALAGLSRWMQPSFRRAPSFGHALMEIGGFFRARAAQVAGGPSGAEAPTGA